MSRIESLSQCIVERYGLSKEKAETFVSEIFAVVRENLYKDKIVKVKGLGTFKLLDVNARESVDVNTGERIVIEGRSRLTFTPENALRDRINSPFSQFESIDIDDNADFTSIDAKYDSSEDNNSNEENSIDAEEQPAVTAQDPTSKQEEDEAPIERLIDVAESVEQDKPAAENVVTDEKEQGLNNNITAGAANNDMETSDTPNVRSPYCEDLIREEITHSRKIIGLLYAVLIMLGIALLFGAVYFGYKLGTNHFHYSAVAPTKPTAKVVVVKPKAADSKPEAKADTPDTAKFVKTEPDSVELMQAIYNKDVRVRTGAYKIVGLGKTVKVQKGQTLSGISRAYFGEGMECYVEVYNDGKKGVKAGEEIKIPLLKLKKRIKR